MAGRKTSSLGVSWHAVNPKTGRYFEREFATTTKADSDLVEAVAAMDKTWSELLTMPYLSTELIKVAERFVNDGFGDEMIKNRVRT